MVRTLLQGLPVELSAWVLLAVPAASVAAALAVWLARRGRPWLPPRLTRPAPWGGSEVLVIVLLIYVVLFAFVGAWLERSEFLSHLYGPGFRLPEPGGPETRDTELAVARWELWLNVFLVPLQLAAIGLVMQLGRASGISALGLGKERLAEGVESGLVAWLVTTPVIFSADELCGLAYRWLTSRPPDIHPLTLIAHDGSLTAEWVAIALLALVGAPLIEELLFRGVLQGWFAKRLGGPEAGLATACLVSWALAPKTAPWAPLAFTVIGAIGFFMLCARRARVGLFLQPYRAIYASALLFAAAHSAVWPTPIPLFLLGLVLGYLAYRTRSLTAPLVLHSLFNAVALVALWLGA